MVQNSIILASGEILLRKFLRMIIQETPEYVISEADDYRELRRSLREATPDAVVLDVCAPSLTDLDVVEEIKKKHPQVKIIILTKLQIPDHFCRAIGMGVEAYVLKKDIGKIDYIINSVLQGGTYISSHNSTK